MNEKTSKFFVYITSWSLGLGIALNYLTYTYLSSLRGVNYGSFVLTKYDMLIPVFTSLIPSYLFFYIFILLMAVLFSICFNFTVYKKFLGMWILNFLLSFIIYLIFPTSQNVLTAETKSIMPLHDPLYLWLITSLEPAWGAFPSVHVSLSVSIFLFFLKYYPASLIKNLMGISSLIWILLMLFSTMSLKVHYINDVISGVVLSYICYYLSVYKDIFCFERSTFMQNNYNLTVIFSIATLLSIMLFVLCYPENLMTSSIVLKIISN